MTTCRLDREVPSWALSFSISSLPDSGAALSHVFPCTSFPPVLSPMRLTPSPSGFLLLLLHHRSSVVTCSFGQLNWLHLWFPNASGAAWYFPSSAPFTASPLPLPFSVFLRLSSFIASFLLFQLVPWQPNSFSWLFLPSLGGWLPSLFLFLTTSFFFVSGILRFHPSSLSNVQLPTFSG